MKGLEGNIIQDYIQRDARRQSLMNLYDGYISTSIQNSPRFIILYNILVNPFLSHCCCRQQDEEEEGGDGEAEDEEEVAVKVLTLRDMKNWKQLDLFQREAKVLKSLRHPGIPRYSY